MAAISEVELLALMNDIASGAVTLEHLQHPQQVYAGPVEYRASNGWRIWLFNFANLWDYLERVVAPDGREARRDEMKHMAELERYLPSLDVAWKRWGLPGDCTFRCVQCEREVERFSQFVRLESGMHVCRQCAPPEKEQAPASPPESTRDA